MLTVNSLLYEVTVKVNYVVLLVTRGSPKRKYAFLIIVVALEPAVFMEPFYKH